MADATGHIRVETIIDQSLQAGLNQLSASIGVTTGRISALNSVSKRLSESSRGVNASLKFLTETERGIHAITQQLAISQITLSNHFAQVRREAIALNAVLGSNSNASKTNASAIANNIAKVKQMDIAQQSLNRTMRSTAMMDMSKKYNKQATELSYVGQRLTMGLTLPLMAVGRIGFTSLKKLDQETIRTSKLLNDAGMEADVLESKMKDLGDRLDKISFKWGVSRELLQGLAGDFAELGISAPSVLAGLVQITNEIEKLGNVDITEANELTKAVYQNILKLRRVSGQDVTSDRALESVVSQVRGAVALFNFAENKTSLSLKDIAQSFPEVQAAATTFGLSMQTTAALLVPMVSAGIKTGTAANALKVSLQRLIIPTHGVQVLYKALNKELGPNFKTSMDIGTQGIQDLIDSFMTLEKSAYGTKGTLQLFARAFGVRQGTRMDLSIQQLTAFQRQLNQTGPIDQPDLASNEVQILRSLQERINAKMRLNGLEEVSLKTVKGIGDLNIAQTEMEKKKDRDGKEYEVLSKRAKLIKEAQAEELNTKKKLTTVQQKLNLVSTESGKILIGGAFGTELTGATMEGELAKVEGSLNVQAGKVREAMKSMARDATVAFGSILGTIGPILQKIAIFIKNLSPGTKKLIGFFALFLLSMGPLVRVFSLFRQAAGLATFGMAKGMMVGKSRAIELNEELLRVNDTFLKLGRKNAVSEIGGKLVFSGKQKVFNRAEQLSALQASQAARDPDARGLGARLESRKIRGLERRLGISSTTEANYAGLKPETASEFKNIYASQAALIEATKKATAAAQDFATRNKPTSLGQLIGDNNPLRGFQIATTQALDLIKKQSLISPQTILKKAGAGVAAATQKASAKVSVDPFMKTILNAIKSILQEIARCTCAKNPLAAGKPSPTLGAVSSRGSPGPSGNGSASTGVTVNPVVAASAGQKIADEFSAAKNAKTAGPTGGMFGLPNVANAVAAAVAAATQSIVTPQQATAKAEAERVIAAGVAQNARNAAVIANLQTQQPVQQPSSSFTGNLLAGLQEAVAKGQQSVARTLVGATAQQPIVQTPTAGQNNPFAALAQIIKGQTNAISTAIPAAVVKATQSATSVAGKPAAEPATGKKSGKTLEEKEAENEAKAKEKAAKQVADAQAKAAKKEADDAAKAKEKAANAVAKQTAEAAKKAASVQDRLRTTLGTDMFSKVKDMGFNMSKVKIGRLNEPSFELNQKQLVGMFKQAGQAVPNELTQLAELIDSKGRVLRISLAQMVKLFESISAGKFAPGAKALTRANISEMIPNPSTALNAVLRNISGGSTRVEAGKATYTDLARVSGRAVDVSGKPRRGYGVRPNPTSLNPSPDQELPLTSVDRRANNRRVPAMLAGGSKVDQDGVFNAVYGRLKRQESTVFPGRLDKLENAPVGNKIVTPIDSEGNKLGKRSIPTNVGSASAKDYQKFAAMRANQIQVAKAAALAYKKSQAVVAPKTTELDDPRKGTATGAIPQRLSSTDVAERVQQSVNRVAKGIEREREAAIDALEKQGSRASEKALSKLNLSKKQIATRLSVAAAAARPGAEKEVMANLGQRLNTARVEEENAKKTGSSKTSIKAAQTGLEKDLAPLLEKEAQDKKIRDERTKLAEKQQRVKQLTDSQPARLAEISKIESITAKARTDEQKKLLDGLKRQQRALLGARTAVTELKARVKVSRQHKFMSDAEVKDLAEKKKALTATTKLLKDVTATKGSEEAAKKVAAAKADIRKSGLSKEQQERLLKDPVPTPKPAPKSTGVLAGMGYLPPPRDIVATTKVGEVPDNKLPTASSAQQAVNDAQVRLANLMSVKAGLKQPPSPYASPADVEKIKTDLDAKLKALKLGKQSLDTAIQKAQDALKEAQQKLAASLAPKAGGGGVGGTSMVMGPMLGMTGPMLGARAGLVEKFGPKMPTMTTGSTAGSSSTVFAEIQKALQIPDDVMKQVKDTLASGFTNAKGEVRKAQVQLVGVGNASRVEIVANLDKFIETLRSTLGLANKNVVEIAEAFRNSKLGSLETPVLKAIRTGGAPATTATPATVATAPTTATKARKPFNDTDRKASKEQVQEIASLLKQHNMEVAELKELDTRTLRKLVETFAKTNESLKGGITDLSNLEKAKALVKALNDSQKSFVTLQEVYTKLGVANTTSIDDAKNAVKNTSTTPIDSSKAVTAVEGLQRSTKSVIDNHLATLARVTSVTIANSLLPSAAMVIPAVGQVPGAVKTLDNAAADHVTKLAEMMRRAAGQLSATPLGFAGAQQLVQNMKSTTLSPMPVVTPQVAPANFAPPIAKFNIKASQVAANLAKINPRNVLETVAPASVATQRAGAVIAGNRPPIANFAVPGRTPAFDPSGVLNQIKSVINKSLVVPPKVASIADIPIPKRGSARSYDIPEPPKLDKLTKLNSFVGKLVAITSRVTSSRAAQVLDGGGAGLMPGLTALKPGLLAPLFQRQNRFVPTDYEGQAKSRITRALVRRNIDPTTSRQVRRVGQEATREGAAVRGVDRPNELVRMVQGRLPSQFIQSLSPMLNQFKAIKNSGVKASDVLRDFAPRIYKASVLAGSLLKKSAPIAARVAKEMVKFPITANVAIGRAAQVVTAALTPSARTLADSLRSVGTKISGAIQRGFIASGVAESSPKAAKMLEIAGKTLSFSVQTAFSMVAGSLSIAAMAIQSPRQALSQGIAGITGAYTRTATAVKGSIAKLAAAGGGGPLGLVKGAAVGAAKGAFSLAAKPVKAVAGVVASQVQQSRPYMAMMGGPVVKADDGTASKKGGFFTASKTYDAQGAVTSKSGGFAKNMAAVPFNAIAGGMKMIGGATSMAMGSVSSLANMMLYKLGPAGFLLMPILGKVTAGLQAMGARALLIVLPLLTIFAVFKIVKKGWASFSKYTTDAGENFKKVKKIFEEIINSIKEIFFDFFATLTGGGKDASAATPAFGDTTQIAGMKKMGASIEEFSKKALAFAKQFKIIFDKYIAPFIYQFLAGFALILKGVVNVFMGIFNVIKGIYQKIRGEGDNGTGALKAGWDKLKDGIGTVLKGIIKMFLPVLTLLINVFFKFVELVVQLFEFLGFAVVNIIRYMVKTIISVATGIVSIFAFVIDKVIEAFVFLQTNIIKIYRFILEVGVNVGKGILNGFIWAIQKILDAFGGLLVGVGDLLGVIPALVGAVFGSIAKKIEGVSIFGFDIGKKIAPIFEKIADGFNILDTGLDAITGKAKSGLSGLLDPVTKGIDAGANALITVFDKVAGKAISVFEAIGKFGDIMRGKIAEAGNAARDGVDGIADGANRLIASSSDAVNSLREGIVNWLDSFAGGDDIMKGLGAGAKQAIDDAVKNTDPQALAAAGEDIANAIQEGLKNVKMNFFEKVIDNLGKALEKQKSKLVDALNLQKDNQLKIFDDQIAAIDALAAAEEKLTATIEFENKKREAEAERSLQRKNYEKQRALAIYEGRIDDARTLDQEETKNRKDAEKNLRDMETDRNKTLQGEQRDTAKTIIGQQKTKAAEAFDKDIKAFEEFAANVLSKGTFTQAELESQFAEISNKASEMSLDMRDSFATFYTALPGLISANTNSTVGFFNTGLQTLVDAAKAKFGLDAEVNADSILGSTALMLNGSTAMFAEKMPLVLEEYKKGTDALAQVGIDWATPGNPNSPESIYGKAIADANAAMIREFMKMKTEAGSAFAEVVKEINAQIKDIAIADAIKEATAGLKKVGSGGESGGDSGGGTGAGTGGTSTPQTSTITYPKTAAELGLDPAQTTLYNDAMSGVVMGSGGSFNPFQTVSIAPRSPAQNKSLVDFKAQIKPKAFFETNSKGALVSNIKTALKFYGYDTGSTSDTFGTAAATAVAQFQEKYAISPVDGKVRENTARALGLFSSSGVEKRYYGGAIKRMMGGPVGAYGAGGTVPGFAMQAVPALLHGGEYVINAKAVQNLGSGFLQYINSLKNGMPKFGIPNPSMPNVNVNQTVNVNGGNSENINNYNFYVDNFIGEDKWFEGMMNEYNVKVVPNKQKSAGLESRVIRSYNGINKGI